MLLTTDAIGKPVIDDAALSAAPAEADNNDNNNNNNNDNNDKNGNDGSDDDKNNNDDHDNSNDNHDNNDNNDKYNDNNDNNDKDNKDNNDNDNNDDDANGIPYWSNKDFDVGNLLLMNGGDGGWWIGKLVEMLDVIWNSHVDVLTSAPTGDFVVHEYMGNYLRASTSEPPRNITAR